MFTQMCILAGCDYVESLQGVGIMTAMQAVVRFKDCPNVKDTESGVVLKGCDARFHAIASFSVLRTVQWIPLTSFAFVRQRHSSSTTQFTTLPERDRALYRTTYFPDRT